MDQLGSQLDTSVPHPARRYNYWLGGKDNFAADRESGDEVARVFPTIRIMALANRRLPASPGPGDVLPDRAAVGLYPEVGRKD